LALFAGNDVFLFMYIIDGHNLIGSGLVPGISLEQADDEWRLVQWLRAHQPQLHQPITVVFDGGIPGGVSRALSGGGVRAVFAASYRTKADKVILDKVRDELIKKNVVVVTNDAVLRQAVRGLGARVLSQSEFMALASQRKRQKSPHPRRLRPEPKLSKQEVETWLQLFQRGEEDGVGE